LGNAISAGESSNSLKASIPKNRAVRGFSPAEMALPNHPETAYEFVKSSRIAAINGAGAGAYGGATGKRPGTGGQAPAAQAHLQKWSWGGSLIIAIIKTQGSDTKLVAQMQPYYEAKGLSRCELAGKQVPPIVTQIADGENGGVMMNEFRQSTWSYARVFGVKNSGS